MGSSQGSHASDAPDAEYLPFESDVVIGWPPVHSSASPCKPMQAREKPRRCVKQPRGSLAIWYLYSTDHMRPAADAPMALTVLVPTQGRLRMQVHDVLRAVVDPVNLNGGEASEHEVAHPPDSPRLGSCSCSTCTAATLAVVQQPAVMCRVPLPEHLSSGYVTPEEELAPQDPEAQVKPATYRPLGNCSVWHALHQIRAWASFASWYSHVCLGRGSRSAVSDKHPVCLGTLSIDPHICWDTLSNRRAMLNESMNYISSRCICFSSMNSDRGKWFTRLLRLWRTRQFCPSWAAWAARASRPASGVCRLPCSWSCTSLHPSGNSWAAQQPRCLNRNQQHTP